MLLFPCLVTLPSGSQRSICKVYATPEGTDVWAWDTDQRKAVVIAHGDDWPREEDRHVWTLDTTEGEVRIVHTPGECGCGHPMKAFRPATPMREYAPPARP